MTSKNLLLAATAMAAALAVAQPVFAQSVEQPAAEQPAKAKKAKKIKVAAAAPEPAAAAKAPAPVVGPTVSEKAEIEALRKQIKDLAEQLNDLKLVTSSKVNTLEKETVEALADKANGKGVAFTYANGRPTLSTADGKFTLAFRVRSQLDGGKYFQDANLGSIPTTATTTPITGASGRLGAGVFFRRMFFGIEGRILKDWEYEVRLNGGASGTEQAMQLDNIRLGYRGFDGFIFEAGAWDIGFTQQQALGSQDSFFLERSSGQTIAVGTFGAGGARKAVGGRYFMDVRKTDKTTDNFFAMAYLTGDPIANPNAVSAFTAVTNSTSGVVTPVANPASDGTLTGGVNQSVNVITRAGYRYVPDVETAFTLEGNYGKVISPKAFVASTLPGSAVKAGLITLSDRPEFRADPTSLISTGAVPIKSADMWNVGASGQYLNFMVMGDYYKYSLERDQTQLPIAAGGFANPEFEAYDVTASWIITGERRGFNREGFAYGGVSPKAPFSLSGGTGAFEAVARYSMVDLNYNAGAAGTAVVAGRAATVGGQGATALTPIATDGRIRGGKQEITSLGLNWYPNVNVKFMLDYQLAKIDRLNNSGQQIGQDLNILASRVQFQF